MDILILCMLEPKMAFGWRPSPADADTANLDHHLEHQEQN